MVAIRLAELRGYLQGAFTAEETVVVKLTLKKENPSS